MEPVSKNDSVNLPLNPSVNNPLQKEEGSQNKDKTSELAKELLAKEGPKEAPKAVQRKAKKVTEVTKDDSGLSQREPTLQRRLSAPELGGRTGVLIARRKDVINTATPEVNLFDRVEQRHLARKSAKLWNCIERIPNRSGGYLYKFKLKPEFIDVKAGEAVNKKIYPGIEPSANSFKNLFSTPYAKFFKFLGYDYKSDPTGVYLTFPDIKTLKAGWQKLQEELPGLADLDIISASGIASSFDFMMANIQHEGLLSSSKEFVHDHYAHISKVIFLKLTSYSYVENKSSDIYEKAKFRIVKHILKAYRIYSIAKKQFQEGSLNLSEDEKANFKKHLDRVEMSLGSLLDSFTSIVSLTEYVKVFPEGLNANTSRGVFRVGEFFRDMWKNEQWEGFFAQHFNKEDLMKKTEQEILEIEKKVLKELPSQWLKMMEIERDFDRSRKKWTPKSST